MSLTFFIHLPMKIEPIRSSETSAIKTQTLENYAKRNILQLKHGESLKTRLNAIPLQAWRGPEVSRSVRLPDFKTSGA